MDSVALLWFASGMWFQDSRETGNMPKPFSPDRPNLQNANPVVIKKQ
jgi:hypothetical protein